MHRIRKEEGQQTKKQDLLPILFPWGICSLFLKRSVQYNAIYVFYATLAYIRHFIFAGGYDNDPWHLVTNLAGHLDLAGFYFSKCPANDRDQDFFELYRYCPNLKIMIFSWLEHAPLLICCWCSTNELWRLSFYLKTPALSYFLGFLQYFWRIFCKDTIPNIVTRSKNDNRQWNFCRHIFKCSE
jgi:hypothetical protein